MKSLTPAVPAVPTPSASPAGLVMPQGREGIGQRVNPLHAALHTANAARLSAMDRAQNQMANALPKSGQMPKGLPPLPVAGTKAC